MFSWQNGFSVIVNTYIKLCDSVTARKVLIRYTGMGTQILAPKKKDIHLNLYKYFYYRLFLPFKPK